MKPEIEEQFRQLKNWARSLVRAIESNEPLVEKILDGENPNPAGAPSRGSLAVMQMGGVQSAIEEVNGAYKTLYNLVLSQK